MPGGVQDQRRGEGVGKERGVNARGAHGAAELQGRRVASAAMDVPSKDQERAGAWVWLQGLCPSLFDPWLSAFKVIIKCLESKRWGREGTVRRFPRTQVATASLAPWLRTLPSSILAAPVAGLAWHLRRLLRLLGPLLL